MKSHLLNLVIFSALVSAAFAMLQRNETKDRLRYGLMAFGAFVLSALVVGWLMFPFPT